jgi:hypothetical protein
VAGCVGKTITNFKMPIILGLIIKYVISLAPKDAYSSGFFRRADEASGGRDRPFWAAIAR